MGLKLCVFRSVLLLSLVAVIIQVHGLSFVESEDRKQGNNSSPATQVLVLTAEAEAEHAGNIMRPLSRSRRINRRSISSEFEFENDEVNCQVLKTQLSEFHKGLKSVIGAVHDLNSDAISAPTPPPIQFASTKVSECDILFNTVTRTANETWKLLSALVQIQKHGECYFQSLKLNHSAEVNRTKEANKIELHQFEIELNFSHTQVLKRVKEVTLEIEKALQDKHAMDLISRRRLEMEGKFKSICLMHQANVTKSVQESPIIPASEAEPDTSSMRIINFPSCYIPAQQLQTIQFLADESTRLIIQISKNNFAATNIKNNTLLNTVTIAACSTLLSNTNKALQQLKANRNNIPADLIKNNQNRVTEVQKSHDEMLSNLKTQFHQKKEDLEARYVVIRRSSQNQLNILETNLSKIIDNNLDTEDAEIAKLRQLAQDLVTCNQTPSAFHILEQFYIDFKKIGSFLPFPELTQDIDLVPRDNNEFENMIFGNTGDRNATVTAEQINQRFHAIFQKADRKSPSFLVSHERVQSFLRNCSPAQDDTGTHTSCNGRIPKTETSTPKPAPSMVPAEIINDWVDVIMESRFEPILNYTQKTSNGAESMTKYLPQLVNATYSKNGVKSTRNLLEFVAAVGASVAMPSIQAFAYSQLFELLQKNKEIDNNPLISVLAWRVKNELATTTNIDDKAKLESIKLALPESMRRLVFVRTGYVIIESMRYSGYTLYASKFGNIYTYPFYNYVGGKNQKWKVHSFENGRYFSFENVENGKVFFEATGKCVKGEGRSLTAHKQQWEVYSVNNGSSVVFRNRGTGHYLSGGYFENCRSSRTGKKTRPQMYVKKYSANQEWSIVY